MDSSHSTGYDFEVICDIGKDFECGICMLLLREPVELPCAHVFCKVCLEHWQDNPMEKDASFLCPSCKKVYHREQVIYSKFLDRYVKISLQVECKENKFGCHWEGKIIDYTQHEEMCVHKSINCTFVGCKEEMIVINLAKHQTECMHRSVQCKHCLLEVQFINLENHYGNCVEYPVNCPNDGCSIITPRKEVCSHTQNECPYQIVNCEYTTVGCKHKHQRRYTCEHEKQCLPDHTNMLLYLFNTTSQELSSLKEKLQQTDENLRQTEERLQQTENRLQVSEEKLAINEEKLQETKIILNETQEELQNTIQDLLQAKDKITKVINHDLDIDNLCFQLARRSTTNLNVKPFDVNVGLESLATMDYYEIPELNITLNSPDMLSYLSKLLEEKFLEKKEKGLKISYVERFIQVMDIMETNKLYRPTEKEVFVKVNVANYKMIHLDFADNENYQLLKMNSDVIFSSENVLLYEPPRYRGTDIGISFYLPGWNSTDTKIFLLNPTENDSTLIRKHFWEKINENTITKNTLIVKGIKEI